MRALVTILLCYVLVISPALSELGKLGSSHSGAFAKLADETRFCLTPADGGTFAGRTASFGEKTRQGSGQELRQESRQGLDQEQGQNSPPALPTHHGGASDDDCCFAACRMAGATPALALASHDASLPARSRQLVGITCATGAQTPFGASRAIESARGPPVIG